ncbi:MAG TPA: ABC transporter ATP-binding protein [Candidatus Obscuribacterales bacterium]
MVPSPSPALTIETHKLNRHFGSFQAVQNLDLQVPQGAFFGFLGPNGAGKSTTIKMLTGLLQPSSGEVLLLGQNIWKQPEKVKRLIGVVPEKLHLFERLTAVEYLEFVGAMYGMEEKLIAQRSEELLDLMELDGRRDLMVADYSHGMKKKLALAAALIHNPRLLFLDEPFEGVDAVSAKILRQLLQDLTARQVTIFLTSHIMEIVEKLCDHLGIIHKGRLIAAGPMSEVLARLGSEQPLGTASLEDAFIQMVGQGRTTRQLSWIQ